MSNKRQTRRAYLQALVNAIPALKGTLIEFRGRGGWALVSDGGKFIGDNGVDYIGTDWRDAEAWLKPWAREYVQMDKKQL